MKLTKTLLIAPLVAGALITTSFAANDSKDDVSYSIGYTMGQTLKNQMDQNNISMDNAEMVNGLKDGIGGSDSKLTQEQMQKAMMDFQKQAVAAQKNAQSK